MQNKGSNDQILSVLQSEFVFMRRNKISKAKINKNAEIGLPRRAPLLSIKYFVVLSPLMTHNS